MDDGDAAERLALALARTGLQRMVARVLAVLLFTDSEAVTASELAERLGASAGSISTALGMLRTVALIEQVPAAGRSARFRLRDDAWATLMSSQNAVLGVLADVADQGLGQVPPDGLAAVRLRRMRSFYTFLLAELPALVVRWQEELGEQGEHHHRDHGDGEPQQ